MKIRNHNKWIILALVSFFRVFEKPHPLELGLVTLRALFSIGGDSRIVAKQTFPIVPIPIPKHRIWTISTNKLFGPVSTRGLLARRSFGLSPNSDMAAARRSLKPMRSRSVNFDKRVGD